MSETTGEHASAPLAATADPVLRMRSATLRFGDRVLWNRLNLDVRPGEFIAVLGPNGTGKTSLLKAILGQQSLSSGTLELLGRPVGRGSRQIGYIPQQKLIEQGTPLRARDLVTLGITGHRWGLPVSSPAVRRRVDEVLESVGATSFAGAPVASLSGGEQQRIRVGQAIADSPKLLLCDEPLISLDLNHQHVVSELIDERRKALRTAVLFVTHDVNPILDKVDRVLYLAGGNFRIGTPEEVLRSEVLSYMYGTPVEVIRTRGRVAVLGAPEGYGVHDHLEHHVDDGWHR
ncbi:zinc/manganese transport system ATP-binding protein [Homoserinimonas aerilata]|uniref:Zinc/manganese transport system ATP-binding protein n=1 Tax=Homoserinimonas aerilata TaxID=1162970 RepID=A0A542YER5_9MICO|nr:ATP-binding cassette domain-containing protein [Homoserinimonas aerilata]TQL46585.1 zinc/manganese transport system ATP-binding protein [Homoserinimonas aerilata]